VTRASTLDEIYLAALTAVRRALDVARAAILLFDADGVLRFKASHGLSDTYRRAAEGHARWVRDSIEAEPLLVPDVQRDERLTTLRPVILAEGVRAMAFFPLRQPARLLGQFMAYADVPHAFTAMDVMLGRLIATQVAFAVERAQAEVTRHRLAAIVDSSDDVIVSKTLDGIITSWNHSAERLFGWTAAGAIGKHITLIIPDDRRSEEDDVLARLRRGERVDHFETVRRRKDGSLVDVSITVSPVRDGFGQTWGPPRSRATSPSGGASSRSAKGCWLGSSGRAPTRRRRTAPRTIFSSRSPTNYEHCSFRLIHPGGRRIGCRRLRQADWARARRRQHRGEPH
jgi:PAS domain S-box-containing protein